MQDEGQPGHPPGAEHDDPTAKPGEATGQPAVEGPARYAFEAPPAAPNVQFKRTRRVADGPAAGSRRRPSVIDRLSGSRWRLLPIWALVGVLLISVGLMGVRGYQASSNLREAAALFSQLQQQIRDADLQGGRATLAALQVKTKAAREATDGWLWGASTRVPLVGDDLTAVRTVSEVLDDLAVDGLPALLDVASGLDPAALSPKQGRIDPATLTSAAPKISKGLAVIRHAQERVATIDPYGLSDTLRSSLTQLGDGLGRAETLTATADRAARLLPSMMGSNGPRTYLMLFQNLAEVRATGGMPGAFIVIRAESGSLKIVDQGTTGTLTKFDSPVLPLGENMNALYTDRLTTYLQNVNLTPDFPTTAALVRRMYQMRAKVNVDGVLSADPVALSYLLRVTGAVPMPQGEPLTADNAVRLLLSDVYAKYPNPKDQDAYFATAARATFEALIKGKGNPRGIINELARAAGERRLLVWSADKKEEADLNGTVLAGQLPADDGAAPTVGVFLNDGSGGKLSYYLNQSAALTVGDCTEDGTRELRLTVALVSSAPAKGLPAYVTGLALSGDPYTVRTNVMVFSPTGGGVVGAMVDGKQVDLGTGVERGRSVGVITVDVPPGETRTLDVTIRTGELPIARAPLTPHLRTTPMVRPWKATVTPGVRCA